MQSSKWGPSAWDYLHTLTFNYPKNPTDDHKKYYFQLFNNLKFTLPCKYCRESYSIFFKYIDIKSYLDDRMGITYWLYTIHNIVNLKLNKKKVDFIDVVNYYEKRRAGQNNVMCKRKLCICNQMICCCKQFPCNCNQSNCDQCNKKQIICNCNQSNCDQCNKKQIICNCKKSNCNQCNKKQIICNCKQSNCEQCNKKQIQCNCKQSNCEQCNKKQLICNCNLCNENFDFVNKTKLKYKNVTVKYINNLIESNELKS
jgi:hypothetical protein